MKLFIALLMLSTIHFGKCQLFGFGQKFEVCYPKFQRCFKTLYGYTTDDGVLELICLKKHNNDCQNFFVCLDKMQYQMGTKCLPQIGIFCMRPLLDRLANAIECYNSMVMGKWPHCNVPQNDNSKKTFTYIRLTCNNKLGKGRSLPLDHSAQSVAQYDEDYYDYNNYDDYYY